MIIVISENLAEFLGIMVGDGNIYYNKEKRTYRFVITGHSENDFDYLVRHVLNLATALFGKRPHIWKYKKRNAIAIALYSRKIVDSLLSLGLLKGKKSRIVVIPEAILTGNKNVKGAFLRGLGDTDFSLYFTKSNHDYPTIIGTISSEILAYQVQKLLQEFGIKSNLKSRIRNDTFSRWPIYELRIHGKTNLKKWLDNIGFNNMNHITKFIIWNKSGTCKPHININERVLLLNQLELGSSRLAFKLGTMA